MKITAGCMLLCLPPATYAIDSASLEFGTGNRTKMAAIGLQWKWEKRWWQSNGTHLGGYWNLALMDWRGERHRNIEGDTQNLIGIGITPVFRFQSDSQKGLYAEAGIGANYLSGAYDNNNRQLSTNFQFGDHLAIGYVFQNNLDIGLKFQHFSNGGIKEPNDGVNFVQIRARYSF